MSHTYCRRASVLSQAGKSAGWTPCWHRHTPLALTSVRKPFGTADMTVWAASPREEDYILLAELMCYPDQEGKRPVKGWQGRGLKQFPSLCSAGSRGAGHKEERSGSSWSLCGAQGPEDLTHPGSTGQGRVSQLRTELQQAPGSQGFPYKSSDMEARSWHHREEGGGGGRVLG